VEIQGERIKILSAICESVTGEPGTVLDDQFLIACATGAIRPLLVQRAGKGAMATADMLRGFAIPSGTRLA